MYILVYDPLQFWILDLSATGNPWTEGVFPHGPLMNCGLAKFTDATTGKEMVLMAGGITDIWVFSPYAHIYMISTNTW